MDLFPKTTALENATRQLGKTLHSIPKGTPVTLKSTVHDHLQLESRKVSSKQARGRTVVCMKFFEEWADKWSWSEDGAHADSEVKIALQRRKNFFEKYTQKNFTNQNLITPRDHQLTSRAKFMKAFNIKFGHRASHEKM